MPIPNILQQLSTMVKICLSSLCINEDEFNKAKPLYEEILNSSRFNRNLKFENIKTKPLRNRKRFNPIYNADVQTNIGKVFLKLVVKHFHKRQPYKKIFNINTIKLSYSCTPKC